MKATLVSLTMIAQVLLGLKDLHEPPQNAIMIWKKHKWSMVFQNALDPSLKHQVGMKEPNVRRITDGLLVINQIDCGDKWQPKVHKAVFWQYFIQKKRVPKGPHCWIPTLNKTTAAQSLGKILQKVENASNDMVVIGCKRKHFI